MFAQPPARRPRLQSLPSSTTSGRTRCPRISGKSKVAEAIRYTLHRREAYEKFFHDRRIEIDSNIIERAIPGPLNGPELTSKWIISTGQGQWARRIFSEVHPFRICNNVFQGAWFIMAQINENVIQKGEFMDDRIAFKSEL
jgi:hypothetical protein